MANSLRAKLKKLNYEGKITDEELNELLDKLDGHDKELIKHGHWTDTYIEDNIEYGYCSLCSAYVMVDNYCGYCGAKMDEEAE